MRSWPILNSLVAINLIVLIDMCRYNVISLLTYDLLSIDPLWSPFVIKLIINVLISLIRGSFFFIVLTFNVPDIFVSFNFLLDKVLTINITFVIVRKM